ncbi:hypothetical protein EWM62_18305 [Mucilaginibacter terrigena]|uniref:Tetratricopeptide repeat protein n=1 Tax=Mucilaginibacter terrigena TaxID=2492395 RepID=A0A4Q5LGR4_9SPHI|nr:hypothetical protein [Mucilaginibacter terrigena]RYU86160.1 hypothetical protein EWM62_18305 [Mucilaginibacter terrigena]
MDQYVDSRQKEIFWDLLANPADTGSAYAQSLERLVHDHPQSGILQVLLARAGDKQQLSKASVYYNPRTLHKLINHPGHITEVASENIIALPANVYSHAGNADNNTAQQEVIVAAELELQDIDRAESDEETTYTEEISTAPVITDDAGETTDLPEQRPEAGTDGTVEEVSEPSGTENDTIEDTYHPFENSETPDAGELPVTAETDSAGDIPEPEPVIETEQAIEETTENITPAQAPSQPERPVFGSRFPKRDAGNIPREPGYPQQDIEDDVYDEIVSIEDIGFEAIASEEYTPPAEPAAEARFSDPYVESGPEEEEASSVLFHQPQPVVEPVQNYDQNIADQEERLILGGIVNADYLSFDKKLDELRGIAPADNAPAVTGQPQQVAQASETKEVSRYDDDKMPYTFMWWLDKTRKEHAGNFQPYAADTEKKNDEPVPATGKTGPTDELQQQYYENIFSLTSVSGVDRDTDPARVEFDHTRKEDVIIERFIHTEPQIKPLSADKLDNENKAKKSSEDQNELVTETLARIYSDQMLYHKAIATYKKLILKFPEKKLYFASQIEQLEKKTN